MAEMGTTYTVMIFALFLSVVLDAFNAFRVFAMKKISIKEYCTVGLRWFRIAFNGGIGVFLLYTGVMATLSFGAAAVHFIVGGLLLADCIFGIAVKKKYGRK
ncbi:MAG: DUF4407 domain-containing protein [Oscillospiraceae bacterium]|nr:DUF4407 domain-containing protein [Oscillospiraceae bacterium]